LIVVCLISGGIDSPVAAYSMARQGVEVVLLHMDNRPYSDESSLEKVYDIRERLEAVTGQSMRLFIAPHGRNQELTANACKKGFQCVICKRTMLRTANGVALRLGAEAIVTGESLGQVASQTLQNLKAESHGLDFPVLRPLIGSDKLEIEGVAKRIGTYEISVRSPSVCTIVPKRPVTMARIDRLLDEERKLDYEEMISYAVEHLQEFKTRHRASS
jgi:thiamine biosynthesis protein ThiI